MSMMSALTCWCYCRRCMPLLTTLKNHNDSFYERMPISPILLSQSHLLNDCVHYMPSILSAIILCCTINALTKKPESRVRIIKCPDCKLSELVGELWSCCSSNHPSSFRLCNDSDICDYYYTEIHHSCVLYICYVYACASTGWIEILKLLVACTFWLMAFNRFI